MFNKKRIVVIGIVFLISLVVFSSFLNNVQALQNDTDLTVSIHGTLESNSAEIQSNLMSIGTYTYFETPRLDLGLFQHDLTIIDIERIQYPQLNHTSAKTGAIYNATTNHTIRTAEIPQYDVAKEKDTVIDVEINYITNFSAIFLDSLQSYQKVSGSVEDTYYNDSRSAYYNSVYGIVSFPWAFENKWFVSEQGTPIDNTILNTGLFSYWFVDIDSYNATLPVYIWIYYGCYGGGYYPYPTIYNGTNSIHAFNDSKTLHDKHAGVGAHDRYLEILAYSDAHFNLKINQWAVIVNDSVVYRNPFKNIQCVNFTYEILGINYNNTIQMVYDSSSFNSNFSSILFYNYTFRYYFDSTMLTNFTRIANLRVSKQNLTLVIDSSTSPTTYNYSIIVSYSSTAWKIPSEIDMHINGVDIIDDTYNSGHVYFDSFQTTLSITANLNVIFELNITSDFSFSFDLDIVSSTYLRKEFELLSNHLVSFSRIDLPVLDIKKIYFNTIDLGSSNPNYLFPKISMNTGNEYSLDVILAEDIYIPLQYYYNDLGTGTSNVYISGISNTIKYYDLTRFNSISLISPNQMLTEQAILQFSNLQYTPYYEPYPLNDTYDSYSANDTYSPETVSYSNTFGEKDVYYQYFDNITGELTHVYYPYYNSTYDINGQLVENNRIPSEFRQEAWNDWGLTYYNYTYTDSGHYLIDFNQEAIGTKGLAIDWIKYNTHWGVSATTEIISSWQGHNNVLKMTANASVHTAINHWFTTLDVASGWVEMYFGVNNITASTCLYLEEYGMGDAPVQLVINSGHFYYVENGTNHLLNSPTPYPNIFYLVKMVWRADNRYDLYIDNIKVLDNKHNNFNVINGMDDCGLYMHNGNHSAYISEYKSSIDGEYSLISHLNSWSNITVPLNASFLMFNGTKLSNGNLYNIDNSNAVFNSTSGWYYGSPDNFNDETPKAITQAGDIAWVDAISLPNNSNASLIAEYDNHKNVLQLGHDGGATDPYLLHYFDVAQTSGTYEFWWCNADADDATYVILMSSFTNDIFLVLQSNKYYYFNGSLIEISGVTPSDGHFDHFKVIFDCSTDTFDLYINGILRADNVYFGVDVPSIDRVKLYFSTNVADSTYLSAPGQVWDANYNEGDNLLDWNYVGFTSNIKLWNSEIYSNDLLSHYELHYSYNTSSKYQTVLFYVWNFDLNSWELVDNSVVVDLETQEWINSIYGDDVCYSAEIIASNDTYDKIVKFTAEGTDGKCARIGRILDNQTVDTVEFWVKYIDKGVGKLAYYLSGAQDYIYGYFNSFDNNFYCYYGNGIGGSTQVSFAASDNTWYHIKIQFDVATDTYSMWFDGILKVDNKPFYGDRTTDSIINVYLELSGGASANSLEGYMEKYEEFYNKGFYNFYLPLNSSYMNSTWDIKVKFVAINTTSNPTFLLYLNKLCISYTWRKISGEIYADTSKSIIYPFLNNWDLDSDYQNLYNVTIKFRYKYSGELGSPFIQANFFVRQTSIYLLLTDGNWHYYSHSFVFNSTSTNNLILMFNITNGDLQFSDFNYTMIFRCLDALNRSVIHQYLRIEPNLDLNYIQNSAGTFVLNFTQIFVPTTQTNYTFYNSFNYSLYSFKILVLTESGWYNYSYNTNSSLSNVISFNITAFVLNLGKTKFYDIHLEFWVSGNNSQFSLDNLILNEIIASCVCISIGYKNPVFVFETNNIFVSVHSVDSIYRIYYDNSTDHVLKYNNGSYPIYDYNFSFSISHDVKTVYNISINIISNYHLESFRCNITGLTAIKRSTNIGIHGMKQSYLQSEYIDMSVSLNDIYNNPIYDAVRYHLYDPSTADVMNGAVASFVGAISFGLDITWTQGYYHLNCSYEETDQYCVSWELMSFEVYPIERPVDSYSIGLKVNGNSVVNNTIQINYTNLLTFSTTYDNLTFDLDVYCLFNHSHSISYSEYLSDSFTFTPSSQFTSIQIVQANLSNIPTNFTEYRFNNYLSTNYILAGNNLQITDLISDMFYNGNAFDVMLSFYQYSKRSVQLTTNPTTEDTSVVFEEYLYANRSFSYWYFVNSLEINDVELEHIRTGATISTFTINGSLYYFTESTLNGDQFTATVDYKPKWNISYTILDNTGIHTKILIKFKSALSIANVSVIVDLSASYCYNDLWTLGGTQNSNNLKLVIPNINFTTAYQTITIEGYSTVPHANITSYQTVYSGTRIIMGETVEYAGYLEYTKYTNVFTLVVSPRWTCYDIHYGNNNQSIGVNSISSSLVYVSGYGFSPSVNDSFIHFATQPFTKVDWQFDDTTDTITITINSLLPVSDMYFLYSWDPSQQHSLVVKQSPSELIELSDSGDYDGYLFFRMDELEAGTTVIKIYVNYVTEMEMLVQFVIVAATLGIGIGLYYYFKYDDNARKKLEKYVKQVEQKIEKLKGKPKGFDKLILTMEDNKIKVEPTK